MSASKLSATARLVKSARSAVAALWNSREAVPAVKQCAVEPLEERILFGVYIGYDYTSDSGPGNGSCATAGSSAGPGGPGDMSSGGPGTTLSGGPGLAGEHGFAGLPPGGTTEAPVNDFSGMPVITANDLSSDAFGSNWGVTRSWSGLNNQSLIGNGWSVIGTPYLEVSGPSTERRINVVVGGGATYSFNVPSSSPYDNYTVIGAYDVKLQLVTGSPNTIRFTDSEGNVTDFYDVYRVSGDPTPLASWNLSQKYGQLKDYISASGTTSITTSYDSNGYLQSVTRSDSTSGASERMVYTYNTVTNSAVTTAGGTPPTLISTVTLQRDLSGTWQDVQRALYTYYTGELPGGGADPNGRLGDLQMEQTQDVGGPVAPSASLASGGSLPASAQYYQVTAVLPNGESSPSSEIEITPTSGNGTVNLSWTTVPNATGYKIYRGSAAGGEQYLGTTSSAAYSDTGAATTTGQPPMVNASYYRYDKFTDEANSGVTTLGPSNNLNTTEGPSPYQESTQPDSLSEALVSSGLRTVVTGPSLAQLAANVSGYQTASDAAIQPYVDHYFNYERWDDHVGEDGSPSYGAEPYNTNGISMIFRDAYQLGTRYRVTDEVASQSGCACTSGQGNYHYEYATNYDPL